MIWLDKKFILIQIVKLIYNHANSSAVQHVWAIFKQKIGVSDLLAGIVHFLHYLGVDLGNM